MQTPTRQKLNWDELGKLYLFPVDNPELQSQGIKSQWFLTHQQDDRLFAGHINNRGEWSLCEAKDLKPTYDYQSVDRIWELLSDDDFVSGLKSATQSRINKNEKVNPQDESNSDNEPIKLDKTQKKKTLVNVGQIPFAPDNKDYYLELDEEELIVYEERERKLTQLNQEEEYLLDFDGSEFPQVSREIEAELTPNQEKEITITEQERKLLESDLQSLLWHGFEKDLLDVENQDPHQPWLIELEEDTGYIKLIATEDQHTVICIDQDGAIVEGLSLEDANLLMDGLISTSPEQEQKNQILTPESTLDIEQNNQDQEWEI